MGNARNFAFWAVAILLLVALFNVFSDSGSRSAGNQIAFSEFLTRVDQKQIAEVTIDGEKITGRTGDNRTFTTYRPLGSDIIQELRDGDVRVMVEPQQEGGILSTLGFWLPMLIIFAVWIFFLNRSAGRWSRCDELWQIQGEIADRENRQGDIRGCRRH